MDLFQLKDLTNGDENIRISDIDGRTLNLKGLTEVDFNSAGEAEELINQAFTERKTASTVMNS